ncbi:MAG TPA: hypothetical protein VII68_05140 [Casimicrobiaceae bacterium]|jgi:hypothetical protein
MNDTFRDPDATLLRNAERKLDELKAEARRAAADAKPDTQADTPPDDKIEDKKDDQVELDDIGRIERRMEVRRQAIREHFAEARVGIERTAKSWPVVAVGAMVAALAIGYVVAQRVRPSPARRARTAWDKVREAPDAARAYVHRATRPTSQVWGERLAAGTGVAMAVMRALPQLRALAEAMPRRRPRDTHRRAP